jgi:glycosyltransferase involved in cell wall biosynthesis
MHIVLVVHGFPPETIAGTELYVYALAQELKNRGHRVNVVYPVNDPLLPAGLVMESTYKNISISRINITVSAQNQDLFQQFKNDKLADIFGDYLANLKPDLVHFHHFIGLSASIMKPCQELGIKTFMTLHDGWLLCEQNHFILSDGSFCKEGPEDVAKCVYCFAQRNSALLVANDVEKLLRIFELRKAFLKDVFNSVDTIIVPSRFLYNVFNKHGFNHTNANIVHLGLPDFQLSPWKPTKSVIRFAYLGYIMPTKGLDILIDAFNLVDHSKTRLDIYGAIGDQTYYADTMKRVLKDHKVKYHGRYMPDRLGEILAKTDVAVVPSRSENYPLIIRECFYANTPVIASNVGGIPEIISDGENGLLFNVGDHKDLANKMRFCINDFDKVIAFRRRIEPPRSIKHEVDEIEILYHNTLNHNTCARNDGILMDDSDLKSYPFANSLDNPQDMALLYETRIKNLEERLNIFYNSNGGRLLLRYYRFRDQFFPTQSIQRKILNYISRFIKKTIKHR